MDKKIFVYGTLMKNERAHHFLNGCDYLGEAVLNDYALFETGSYPAMIKLKGFKVYGELYSVNDEMIDRMDAYEGEGYLYRRILTDVKTDNENIKAYVYEYINDVSDMELRAPTGKWSTTRNPAADYFR